MENIKSEAVAELSPPVREVDQTVDFNRGRFENDISGKDSTVENDDRLNQDSDAIIAEFESKEISDECVIQEGDECIVQDGEECIIQDRDECIIQSGDERKHDSSVGDSVEVKLVDKDVETEGDVVNEILNKPMSPDCAVGTNSNVDDIRKELWKDFDEIMEHSPKPDFHVESGFTGLIKTDSKEDVLNEDDIKLWQNVDADFGIPNELEVWEMDGDENIVEDSNTIQLHDFNVDSECDLTDHSDGFEIGGLSQSDPTLLDTVSLRTNPRFRSLSPVLELDGARCCGLCDDVKTAGGRCLDCSEDLCTSCIKYHKKVSVTNGHNILQFQIGSSQEIIVPVRGDSICKLHNEELKLYCTHCQQAICRDYILTSHKEHGVVDLNDKIVGEAKVEVERLLKRVHSCERDSQKDMVEMQSYQREFLNNIQKMSDVVDDLHAMVLEQVENSYRELTEAITSMRDGEMERVNQLKEIVLHNLRSTSDFTAFAEHAMTSTDGVDVLDKLDVLGPCATPICHHIRVENGHAEILLTRNTLLDEIRNENMLGEVACSVMWPPVEGASVHTSFIREIRLKREIGFHLSEKHSTKSSVLGIAEDANGFIWVAAPRSLVKIDQDGMRKRSAALTSELTHIAAGPEGRLLVAFRKSNAIKVLANNHWSSFSTLTSTVTSLTSSSDGQRVLVPQVSSDKAKLMVICNLGRDIVKIDLPHQFHGDLIPSLAISLNGEVAMCVQKKEMVVILTAFFEYKTDYHGPEGALSPSCVCYDKLGHLIVADAEHYNVQLVSRSGQFLFYLLTKDDFIDIGPPTAVSVDSNGRLWIGTGNGNVCAYTYMQDIA